MLGVELWYPTSREKRARCPDFLQDAPSRAACAAFCKESRMKFIGSNKLYRKSGGVGHPLICGGERAKPFAPWTELQWFCFL